MAASSACQATPDTSAVTIDRRRLRDFSREVFERCGMPATDAEILTDQLVWADLRGISRQGAAKIPEYVTRLRGGVPACAGGDVRVRFRRGGFLVVDAADAFGQVVGYRVMKQMIRTARSTGISAAVIRGTTSAGALGYLASLAVEEKMVGLAIIDPPVQITSGDVGKVIGDQALAVASPAARHPPLVLDTAAGKPAVDPIEALDGILLPIGGRCGFGLALLWQVLTCVLAASSTCSVEARGVSMLLLAVDPTVSTPYERFTARVDDLVDRIHGAPHPDRAEGIPLPAELRAKLRTIAAELGVQTPL